MASQTKERPRDVGSSGAVATRPGEWESQVKGSVSSIVPSSAELVRRLASAERRLSHVMLACDYDSSAPWSSIQRRARLFVIARDGLECSLCGYMTLPDDSDFAIRTTVDHIIPQSLGGGNELENLRIACGGCNSSRGNRVERPEPEWDPDPLMAA